MKFRWLLTIPVAASLCAQELTNDAVIKLVKAGLGEDIIVSTINQQRGKYSLTVDDLITLKKAGASDRTITAMISKSGASTAQPTPSGTAIGTTASSPTIQAPLTPHDATSNFQPSGASTSHSARVYITDSQSWEMRGGWSAGGHTNANGSGSWGGGGYQSGGARPQTAEIIKTFNQRCPEITVTRNTDKADFIVILDHEGGKGYARRRNKIVVFNRDGDDIFSDSTRSLGNSVKDACEAIRNAPSRKSSSAIGASLEPRGASSVEQAQQQDTLQAPPLPIIPPPPPPVEAAEVTYENTSASSLGAGQPVTANGLVKISVSSIPEGAVVFFHDAPIGRTPASVMLVPGTYEVRISAGGGYADLIREITVEAGKPFSLAAQLEAR